MVISPLKILFICLILFGCLWRSSCDNRHSVVNLTASYRVSDPEERTWCPAPQEILPCTCTGPRTFPLVTCDRIVNADTIRKVSGAFRNRPRIGKFSLTNSRTSTLRQGELGVLEYEYIHIRKSTITSVDPGSFDSSRRSLKRIEITHCDLESFNFKEIVDFPKLEYIDLKYNSMKSIPDEAFGIFPNSKLKKVDLSFNKITYVGSDAFKYLCNLELLDLRYNKLTVINNWAFAAAAGNPKLTLNLANNKITFVAENAFDNQLFKCLNLTDNNLGKFSEKVFLKVVKEMARQSAGEIFVKNNRFRCTCENVEWFVRLPDVYKSHVVDLECADKNDRNVRDLRLYDIGCQS